MTALPPLVGLIGKKRVGKDTFAAVLVEEFGFARVAFADPLKEMALTIAPIIDVGNEWEDDGHLYTLADLVEGAGWEAVKDSKPEARRFLQRLGDGVRQFDPEFWVRTGMAATARLREDSTTMYRWGSEVIRQVGPTPVVITDVRYPNEADAIREAGGTLIRIVRPGVDDGDTHPSETALDGYAEDATVTNQYDLDTFRGQTRRVAAASWALDWPAL